MSTTALLMDALEPDLWGGFLAFLVLGSVVVSVVLLVRRVLTTPAEPSRSETAPPNFSPPPQKAAEPSKPTLPTRVIVGGCEKCFAPLKIKQEMLDRIYADSIRRYHSMRKAEVHLTCKCGHSQVVPLSKIEFVDYTGMCSTCGHTIPLAEALMVENYDPDSPWRFEQVIFDYYCPRCRVLGDLYKGQIRGHGTTIRHRFPPGWKQAAAK